MHRAATVLQTRGRRLLARTVAAMRGAAPVVQKVWRRSAARQRFCEKRRAAVRLQAAARRFLAPPPPRRWPRRPFRRLAEWAPPAAWARRPRRRRRHRWPWASTCGAAPTAPLVDLFGAAAPTPVVDSAGRGPDGYVDLARERVAGCRRSSRAKSPEPPAVETPRQAPVVPPLRLPAVEDDDAPSVEVPRPQSRQPRPLVVRPKEVAKAPLIA